LCLRGDEHERGTRERSRNIGMVSLLILLMFNEIKVKPGHMMRVKMCPGVKCELQNYY
jgi:hypothetical protein